MMHFPMRFTGLPPQTTKWSVMQTDITDAIIIHYGESRQFREESLKVWDLRVFTLLYTTSVFQLLQNKSF